MLMLTETVVIIEMLLLCLKRNFVNITKLKLGKPFLNRHLDLKDCFSLIMAIFFIH